jgi:hypothetical protein
VPHCCAGGGPAAGRVGSGGRAAADVIRPGPARRRVGPRFRGARRARPPGAAEPNAGRFQPSAVRAPAAVAGDAQVLFWPPQPGNYSESHPDAEACMCAARMRSTVGWAGRRPAMGYRRWGCRQLSPCRPRWPPLHFPVTVVSSPAMCCGVL